MLLEQKANQGDVVSQGIKELAEKILCRKPVAHLHSYLMRILTSRMSVPIESDENGLCASIQRMLVKENKENGPSIAIKFNHLHISLTKLPILQNRFKVVYLLYSLRQKFGVDLDNTLETNLISSYSSLGLPSIGYDLNSGQNNVKQEDLRNIRGKSSASAIPAQEPPSVRSHNNGSSHSTHKSLNIESKVHYQLEPDVTFTESEQLLIRDLLYVFQGIDGSYIKFDSASDSYRLVDTITLPPSIRNLVLKMCEVGWLYRTVKMHVDDVMNDSMAGLVAQAMSSAIQKELVDYYRLIAILEAQINMTAVDSGRNNTLYGHRGSSISTSSVITKKNDLTLRRLYVWILDPIDRLRVMASLCQATNGLRGGALTSSIHSYMAHGNPATSQFIERILAICSAPIFEMIRQWIVDGELNDPFHEFWVTSNSFTGKNDIWSSKYQIDSSMTPSFIDISTAEAILLIGKSINFIRESCKDVEWVVRSRIKGEKNLASLSRGLRYGNITQLEDVVSLTDSISSAKLIEILFNQYKLREHLFAFKNFLLLGQGDFVQHLLENLGDELDKPARDVRRHNLVSILETAVRASNVNYQDSDIVDRLDVKILAASPGETGWDIFILEYNIDDGPMGAVINSKAQSIYTQMFVFLWKIKRVDFTLAQLWKLQLINNKKLRDIVPLMGVLHKGNGIRMEMQHFVGVFLTYIMFDVLERCWVKMFEKLGHVKDMDELISSHDEYLKEILRLTLVGDKNVPILDCLIQIFDSILRFSVCLKTLYSDALEEYERRRLMEINSLVLRRQGDWEETIDTDIQSEKANERMEKLSREVMNQLDEIHSSYQRHIKDLLEKLRKSTSSQTNLRQLHLLLDFNDFYYKNMDIGSPTKSRSYKKNFMMM